MHTSVGDEERDGGLREGDPAVESENSSTWDFEQSFCRTFTIYHLPTWKRLELGGYANSQRWAPSMRRRPLWWRRMQLSSSSRYGLSIALAKAQSTYRFDVSTYRFDANSIGIAIGEGVPKICKFPSGISISKVPFSLQPNLTILRVPDPPASRSPKLSAQIPSSSNLSPAAEASNKTRWAASNPALPASAASTPASEAVRPPCRAAVPPSRARSSARPSASSQVGP